MQAPEHLEYIAMQGLEMYDTGAGHEGAVLRSMYLSTWVVDQIQKDAILLVIHKFKRTNKMQQNSVIVTGLTKFEILRLDWVIQILLS